MSSPLPLSDSKRKNHVRMSLAIVAPLLLFVGLPLVFAWQSDRNESREADAEISRYLNLVQRRDRPGADALLCGGDDTSVASGQTEPKSVLESFTIVRTWDWSSATDGHGKGYQVRLAFAGGDAGTVELAVEVIANDPCIATEIPF